MAQIIRNFNHTQFIQMSSFYNLMIQYIFIAVGIVCLVLFFLVKKKAAPKQVVVVKQPELVEKKNLGELQIFFASQTGTAAKMAANFAEESAEHGFKGVVIDLKDISHNQFMKNQISVFFLANTGEGDPPENSVAFMKMLRGKTELQGSIPCWQNINYAIFGLGDTQYEHFNKIGIDADKRLEQLGAHRIAKIGLGDQNSSMEDDLVQWKSNIWPLLVQFRQNNPYTGETTMRKISSHVIETQNLKYLSENIPTYANYRFCLQKEKIEKKIVVQELDFKTKAGLAGKMSLVDHIIERRQNREQGSSLELEVHIEGQPEYQTASTIALWPVNDPAIVQEVIQYFGLNPDQQLGIQIIDNNKMSKLNFIAPLSVRELLEQSIDLQFKITKGLLKKLSKLQSKSSEYFLTNSSPKTTQQYKRLSENQFTYLFKLIKEYNVKLSFEDFVELSDSTGPRLFTIASSWKAQKNVIVIASIEENGLISKHFVRNPTKIKAQLRKSAFSSVQKWKKIIFIGAGTGFAPFRGYLQDRQISVKEGKQFPVVSLYFGCRKSGSDFIYKQQILRWQQQQIINKLHLAFSRETEKKVYVQNLLEAQQQELFQFINDPETAMYICGSTAMGRDVVDVVERASKKSKQQFKHMLEEWEKSGKLIKELW